MASTRGEIDSLELDPVSFIALSEETHAEIKKKYWSRIYFCPQRLTENVVINIVQAILTKNRLC